ncbi:SpoVK/Ycf46/Vps4 family AAA+-type ATPase [Paenibacillus endophyticus]|uniref:SpoVK/Ycf46/Vps4 family AAA+-type ATPase n=1 Tax=Paenibacillus endophyticus TaxID=1294268 RepID=A0A7W5CDZ5_9BACL|nr:ATP-binding protein [Paenibacillus endophyticus]MBB3155930.1 SpoVK/Ycf46/Vps4 family AAA+-type ATPase [Paenibacillus endophyticus]
MNAAKLPASKDVDMAVMHSAEACKAKSHKLVPSEINRNIIDEVLEIYELKTVFTEQGVSMPNKILMYGPPGSGKTITAYYLAHMLGLPLILVRLDTIIGSYLRETAGNIRKIFDYAIKTPCVFFLDEFVAIARNRTGNRDVQEMSRVVNTLLQCLDEFQADSILLAATNLDEELDTAVWRRFDTKMKYEVPTASERRIYTQKLFDNYEKSQLIDDIAHVFATSSFAEMEQIYMKAKRKSILRATAITLQHIKEAKEEYMGEPAVRIHFFECSLVLWYR